MIELVVRPAARQDLANIWSYTATTWSIEQADFYVGQIGAQMEKLLVFPEIGTPLEGLLTGYRKVRTGSHRIIYRTAEQQLIVVRIIHEREDVPDELDT
ncbi:type II toxin-antitoxin system RelE/ParE family toxin [Erythrobacter sp. NE805]|uniref:type II toxin-antitoxin system RelE/ParE family toxin n=1 Tax=Erythrobacter sp. NE805 TaxID=3389875 RepID=UPI00396B2D68